MLVRQGGGIYINNYYNYILASQRERSVPSAIPTVMSSISASSGTCRIQLKLPGGGSTVVELERSARLAELRGRVAKVTERSMCVPTIIIV